MIYMGRYLEGRFNLGLNKSPLFFEPVQVTRAMVTTPALFRGVIANYLADAILRSPALLGSLQILGSPTGLLSQVLSGLKDLVTLAADGGRRGPVGAISGDVIEALLG